MSISREQAIKDCQEIWKYLAMTGVKSKEKAIEKLYKEGKISQKDYCNSCPLCEFGVCEDCPWFQTTDSYCTRGPLGIYNNWNKCSSKKNASAVYQLTKTFK